MASSDGAEICELAGLCILQVLGEKFEKDKIGLYRDYGLACFGNINKSQAERIQKEFISIFKTEFKLNMTSETNLKIVNKPNNNPFYINTNSNHPLNIIKNLPKIYKNE